MSRKPVLYTHARRYADLHDLAERVQVLLPNMSPREVEALLQVLFDLMGDVLLEYGQLKLGDNAVLSLTRKEDGHAAKFLTTAKKPGPRRVGTYRATIRAREGWKEKYTRFEQGIADGSIQDWDQLKATAWSRLQDRKSKVVRELRAAELLKKWAILLGPTKEVDHGQVRSKRRPGQRRDGKGSR